MTPITVGPVIGSGNVLINAHKSLEPLRVQESSTLPAGFPASLETDLAWTGQQFQSSEDYILKLQPSEIVEVETALEHFKGLELDGNDVGPGNFPLPALGAKLVELARDLYNGRGFCVIRGLDLNRYSVEDYTVIWLGIQSYIAPQQARQDKNGNMLVHIYADKSSEMKAEHHRHSTNAISFHTEESGDIVGWLTRSTAASGGKCIIASAHTIYNVLATARPDLVRVLARSDWPFAFPRFQCRPIIYFHESKLIMNFGRTPLIGNSVHVRPSHLPSLSSQQREALDTIEAIAQATQMEIQTQAGDIHYINNLAVLHRRDAFVDGDEPTAKRHLVRMRIRNDLFKWSIPEELIEEWSRAFDIKGDRIWHLEPMPEGFFPLRMYTN
ncbi:hypothetical protein jhhlp_007307 [Lomentospora prolificans]|uniref:TauD/TfdA-like domain-containing protein n=1 Tax=Lomentospora prolificans TaxID=41688 RepID=A0A2N3N2A4_9PEZI|nr:hypothetical protein jhhlp_007307 [Lomentospora prolificans]